MSSANSVNNNFPDIVTAYQQDITNNVRMISDTNGYSAHTSYYGDPAIGQTLRIDVKAPDTVANGGVIEWPDTSGVVALLAATQTLTNKTITAPTITGAWNSSGSTSIQLNNQGYVAAKDFYAQGDGASANGRVFLVNANGSHQGNLTVANNAADRTWTLPDATGTVMLTSAIGSTVQAYSATLTAFIPAITLPNGSTIAGAVSLPDAAVSHFGTFTVPVTLTGNRTYTAPDASGNFVLDTATQTLTNKTLTAPVLSGSINNSGATSISLGFQGSVDAKFIIANGDQAGTAGRYYMADSAGSNSLYITTPASFANPGFAPISYVLDNFPLSTDTSAKIALKPSFGTATCASNAATLNTRSGQITTESLTTAAGSTQNLTITNSTVDAGDAIILTLAGGGTNTVTNISLVATVTGSHTFVITVCNNDPLAALNGTGIINFLVIKQ